MMGIADIREMNRRATNKAKRNTTQPFVPTEDQKAVFATGKLNAPGASIPFIGDYVPRGWTKDEIECFVDTSGFGRDDEPALSMPRFAREVMAKLKPGEGVALTEQGQFQGYVAIFRPKVKKGK